MLLSCAIVLFVGSLACSAVLTALAKRVSPRLGLVAHPRADRYHRSVIPLGGGIAIFLTLALFLIAGAAAMQLAVAPGRFGGLAERAGLNPVGLPAPYRRVAGYPAVRHDSLSRRSPG